MFSVGFPPIMTPSSNITRFWVSTVLCLVLKECHLLYFLSTLSSNPSCKSRLQSSTNLPLKITQTEIRMCSSVPPLLYRRTDILLESFMNNLSYHYRPISFYFTHLSVFIPYPSLYNFYFSGRVSKCQLFLTDSKVGL